MNGMRELKMQAAADAANDIADAISDLGKMLDRFHAEYGEELYSQLEAVWPDARNFGGSAPKPVIDLARQWTPPEYERA